jgi:hypothetical protein
VGVRPESKKFFDEQIVAFRRLRDNSVAASLAIAGRIADAKAVQASTIFAMMCATSHSINRLLVPISSDYGATIDHGSIASLCRNLIEASILLSYVTEDGVSEEESTCRRLLFCVHDCSSRVRLFKGINAKKQYADQKEILKDLRNELSNNSFFSKLTEDVRKRALTGAAFYLRGVRSAAINAGWTEEFFDGMYSYLSSQPHFAPMSHFGMSWHSVDYKAVSDCQMTIVGVALEQACNALSAARDRIFVLFPDAKGVKAQ